MIVFLLWIFLSFIIASMGEARECGFWGALIGSLFLSPVIGLIIVLVSKRKDDIKHQKIMQQAVIKQSQQKISVADEIEKLKKLQTDGAISEEEFNQMKMKLLS